MILTRNSPLESHAATMLTPHSQSFPIYIMQAFLYLSIKCCYSLVTMLQSVLVYIPV